LDLEDSAAAIIYHGMTFHVVVLCCVTLFLLLVSALVSGSETAFFSLSGTDVRKIRRHDTPVCRRMLNLLGKADLLLIPSSIFQPGPHTQLFTHQNYFNHSELSRPLLLLSTRTLCVGAQE
jgi:hypothetical protein